MLEPHISHTYAKTESIKSAVCLIKIITLKKLKPE